MEKRFVCVLENTLKFWVGAISNPCHRLRRHFLILSLMRMIYIEASAIPYTVTLPMHTSSLDTWHLTQKGHNYNYQCLHFASINS